MALYLISYDINEKDAFEYEKLWAALRGMDAVRILYSEWVAIDTPGKASDIYNRLASLTQQKDRLLVQELGANAGWDKLLISDENFRKWLAHARF
jgi:CRISPR/Cas system-associated endoribonuclease Cas2